MTTICLKLVGRPPKAGLSTEARDNPSWVSTIIGDANNPTLIWNVPREEILAAIQTVGGIAKIALVDRRTILRNRIVPGSIRALTFVRDKRIRLNRPLVEKAGEFDYRNRTGVYLQMIGVIQQIKESAYKEPAATVRDSQAKRRKWKRFGRSRHYPDAKEITNAEREIFKKYEYKYRPPGRITVKMLAGWLQISRWAVYKRLRAMPPAWRKQITGLMNPRKNAATQLSDGDSVESQRLEPKFLYKLNGKRVYEDYEPEQNADGFD